MHRFHPRHLLVALVCLLAAAPAQAQARAIKVTASPTSVTAGGTVTVQVSRTSASKCKLTLRAATKGALISTKLPVKRGTNTLTIPASSATGNWILSVTCGASKRSIKLTVVAPSQAQDDKTSKPTPIAPDEQGFVAGTTDTQDAEPAGGQLGGADYPNSKIADIGLSKVGQNLYTPGPVDHGQCKQAVNDWVAVASGRTQVMGVDYHDNYARNGGAQIGRDQAIKGDVIQLDNPSDQRNYYRGMHTAVVIGHVPGSNTFDVVDSNYGLDDVVRRHTWDPFAAAAKYGLRVTIWRMGTADSAATPPAAVTPTPVPPVSNPTPAAPQTWAETTGGVVNKTFTNWTNAGGNIGPGIPANTTIQIACKLTGFTVADGNNWWYRIATNPWNGQYYASADAFYNNGATSGSLHGTPFVDPAVRNC